MNDLSKLSIGLSVDGVKAYKEKVKTKILTETSDELKKTQGIKDALELGWAGKAREKFIDELDNAVEQVIKDLTDEYNDLEARFTQLENNYLKQDAEMI